MHLRNGGEQPSTAVLTRSPQSPFPKAEGGPSPETLPQLLGSLNSSGFLITVQRKHLAFLLWATGQLSARLGTEPSARRPRLCRTSLDARQGHVHTYTPTCTMHALACTRAHSPTPLARVALQAPWKF